MFGPVNAGLRSLHFACLYESPLSACRQQIDRFGALEDLSVWLDDTAADPPHEIIPLELLSGLKTLSITPGLSRSVLAARSSMLAVSTLDIFATSPDYGISDEEILASLGG